MKYVYGLFCILGVVLPFSELVPWLLDNGLNLETLFGEAVSTRIGTFAWLDILVSAVVLVTFIFVEGARLQMKRLWLPVLATFTVGVSLGLPLFLLMREMHLSKQKT